MTEGPKDGVILVVDDEADLREILEMILCGIPARILTAENGRQALEILRSHEVHAVVSDISMPLMNGLELLREVRGMDLDLPFVFVTAFGERGNLLEALRLGATDFIEKPFENESVMTVMGKALELGLALKKIQQEVDALLATANFPHEDLQRLRDRRLTLLARRAERNLFGAKK